ncbi:subtilase-type protease inhibitor [Streptomyces sp. NBC_01260]|uniref:SSI family serine proteinase inhibitor n=1 Tax=unclassified Streptomyces TaxID=2593676 RepID=UPI000F4995D7|nr:MULTISPECIES: SSI family serine proteinase inhibitor [unclassified Streptomyces]ROQ81477.1 subtilisin inhibitor-like [Streptomyces sp. CEV 2-1]RPK47302.1 Subtilisin inhibitor-like protein 1 [Streptomyces sp. ADI92-24]
MLRRLALTAVVSLAALSAAAPAATASAGPLPRPLLPLPLLQGDDGRTHLTVVVSGSGDPAADGSYELECDPAGGSHPAARQACDRLAQLPGESADPFAPVSPDAMCTQQYGGPATARVTGSWRGRSIDAAFDRTNGCEIGRWNSLRPVLPNVR